MSERLPGTIQEGPLATRLAQGICTDDADALGLHVAQPLPEALEALHRPVDGFAGQPALRVEAGREPHHLSQPVDDRQLTVRVARDHHVKAVRPEVDSREDVGDERGRLGQQASGRER